MQPIFETEHGRLYQGDCLKWLPQVEDQSVDVVFADPPFNLNKHYGRGINDQLAAHEYLEWSKAWINAAVPLVKPGGAFWLYNVPKWNIELGHFLNEAGMMFRHWVAIDIKMSLPIPELRTW